MPVPLLIAVALAFGLKLPTDRLPLSQRETFARLAEAGLAILAVVALAAIVGAVFSAQIPKIGRRAIRRYLRLARVIHLLGLAAFALIFWQLDWVRVVDFGLGLRRIPFVEGLARIVPYLLIDQLSAWGLHPAESRLRPEVARRGEIGESILRARRSAAVILPVCVLDALARGMLGGDLGKSGGESIGLFAAMCAAAVGIFFLSPALVRLAWPLQPLPPGPLRDRLERLSRRLRFRCTDILVWDTGGTVANAGVTGALPWFRYVLLTDLMIEQLSPGQVEAVFGHEVGHVAHRHLPFFAAFFLASAGVLMLAAEALGRFVDLDGAVDRLVGEPAAEVLWAGVVIIGLGAYAFLVFGFLSRRFERQADLFGAKSVSCATDLCSPHIDPNDPASPEVAPASVCRVGAWLLKSALSDVTFLNRATLEDGSWRHGTIAQRIGFLQVVEHDPRAERRFQAAVSRLCWGVMAALALAATVAWGVAGFAPFGPAQPDPLGNLYRLGLSHPGDSARVPTAPAPAVGPPS